MEQHAGLPERTEGGRHLEAVALARHGARRAEAARVVDERGTRLSEVQRREGRDRLAVVLEQLARVERVHLRLDLLLEIQVPEPDRRFDALRATERIREHAA